MSDKKDYYNLLGVQRDATADQIKKAYRKLASKHHPDKGGDTAAFQEIQTAYDVLSDESKRQQYDQYGHGFDQRGRQQQHDPFGHFRQHFDQHFNNRDENPVGDSIRTVYNITLEEAYTGVTKTVHYNTADKCGTCEGTGAKPGTKVNKCAHCNGQGHVQIKNGPFVMMSSCPMCNGTGEKIEERCPTCHGHKLLPVQKTVELPIPAGIEHGQQIRAAGKGVYGPGGYGDLFIDIRIVPHGVFSRDDNMLRTTVEVNFYDAILGGEVIIKQLSGDEISVKIPSGTQPDTTLRAAGKGIKTLRRDAGDMLVKVKVKLPTSLTEEQREIISKYVETLTN